MRNENASNDARIVSQIRRNISVRTEIENQTQPINEIENKTPTIFL